MFDFFGAAMLLAVSALLLRNFGWRGAPVFAVLCIVVLLAESALGFEKIFSSLTNIAESANISEAAAAALKITGIGYLFGICADVVRELGETGMAKVVEIVGRVEIIAVIFPFFEDILRVGVELMG